MSVFHRFSHVITGFLFITLTACSLSPEDEESDTRYYEFTHRDEEIDYSFVAKTSDPAVVAKVEDQLALPLSERNLHIHGDIVRGNDGYNNNWSWHFVPDAWDMVEISTEVCDGRPQMVEDDLDYWVDQVGYFCPWNSVVLREVNP